MFDALRTRAASALQIIAQRIAKEPRYTQTQRVPSNSRTLAGVMITPDTAVTISAVWACLRFVSQTVAGLPWHAFEKVDGGSQMQDRNPIDWLIYKRPNPEWSSFQFRETLAHWALRWGNGYAEIERDTIGRPFALWPIHPERVTVCRDPDSGMLYYDVSNGTEKVEIDAADMFHIRGFGEGVVGVNAIHYAAQSLGWAKAAQTYGATFFGNGAIPTVVVKNKKGLTGPGLALQRAEFDNLHKGPTKAHKSAHLDADAELETLGFDAQQTQLIEVHQFLVEEICRWFGVPPHKVMHLLRATFSNIEHQAIEVVTDCIRPWAKRFEDEADYKLFGQNRRNLFTKINLNGLLQGDMKARMEFYKGMQFVGAYSPNDILGFEDMNSIGEDGDIHVMQEQMTTLENIRLKPVAPATPAAGIGHNGGPPIEEDAATQNSREAFQRIVAMEPAHV